MENGEPLKTSAAVLQKVAQHYFDPAFPFLGTHPRGMKMRVHVKSCTQMLAAYSEYPESRNDEVSISWRMNKHNVRAMQCHSAVKWHHVLIHVATWMNFKNTMLSARSQLQNSTCHKSPCIRNVQNRWIHRDKSRLVIVQGCGGLEGNGEWLTIYVGVFFGEGDENTLKLTVIK